MSNGLTVTLSSPTSFLSLPAMQPAVVYAHELSRLGHGRPMWSPDRPETPVEIGDVGFIENGTCYDFCNWLRDSELPRETGSFKRLFNVTRTPWDRLNSLGVPGNFKRLDLELIAKTENASYLKTGPICSHSINKILKTPSDSSQTYVAFPSCFGVF